MKEIARCEKCGRGFVWLNEGSDMIDHFYPADKYLSPKDMPTDEQCGGNIRRVAQAHP